jgi:hypothetical protein
MLQSRSTALALVTALTLNLSPLALAEEATPGAPSTAQIEQLQAQLAEMQKEMAEMRKALEGSGDIPAERRQMMQQHMGQMEKHGQKMHDCMMNSAKCPHMGMMGQQ